MGVFNSSLWFKGGIMKRERELLRKPAFKGGPLSRLNEYFKGRLSQFRNEHSDFDIFLKEIGELLKKENNKEFNNLILFIDGEPDTNWVCASNSIFDGFIKLYNLGYSSKEAFEYIKQCLDAYLHATQIKYHLEGNYEISYMVSRWDGLPHRFIKLSTFPSYKDLNSNCLSRIDITFSELVDDDGVNDIDVMADIEIGYICSNDIVNDAFIFFNNAQNKIFFRKTFWDVINQLKEKSIIKELEIYNEEWPYLRYFQFKDFVGRYKFND